MPQRKSQETVRVALYARTWAGDPDNSLEVQVEALHNYARRHGLETARAYFDVQRARAQFHEMMARAAAARHWPPGGDHRRRHGYCLDGCVAASFGCSLFLAGFLCKTIIPDSEEHPFTPSADPPFPLLRWIRAKTGIDQSKADAVRNGPKQPHSRRPRHLHSNPSRG